MDMMAFATLPAMAAMGKFRFQGEEKRRLAALLAILKKQ
jgi:hypothetical protein